VASKSPEEFVPGTGTTPTTIVLHDVNDGDGATSRYEFDFPPSSEGSPISGNGLSASNNVEDPGSPITARVFKQDETAYSETEATGRLIDGEQAELTRLFPETFGNSTGQPPPPICEDCSFLKWGAFTTTVAFSDPNEENPDATVHYVDRIAGWWVSGDLASTEEIESLWLGNATATYNGHVLGTVNNDGDIYAAAGKLWMEWDFHARSGELEIRNFDHQPTFGGGLTQVPNANEMGYKNQFGGSLSGEGLRGSVTGSFVRGPSSPAQGVIGNWNVRGQQENYQATGIFAGSGTPRGPTN
jgi:hypothetical protein